MPLKGLKALIYLPGYVKTTEISITISEIAIKQTIKSRLAKVTQMKYKPTFQKQFFRGRILCFPFHIP